ncbi:hypothetical protein PV04_04061 [Phialophora macrospora]|uniref:Uncharacterized protein n=1 Tax=Phialophora macrospora TaxID=1851006 RepID=A0A0D2FJ61_9EURO|nr:hypothetical protein PV04_04061 [Phialophora macrospora]
MPQPWQQDSDNDVEVRSESTVHITLVMRGAGTQDGSEARAIHPISLPEVTTVLPIRPALPAMHREIAAHGRFWCGTMDVMSAEPQNPFPATVCTQQETPTFTFGEPPSLYESAVECPPPSKAEERVKPGPGEVMFTSCGRYPPSARPSKAARRPEYDDATMEDFRRHLGVIDCRGDPSKPSSNTSPYPPSESPHTWNCALKDYEVQSMLLKQVKRERDLTIKQEFEDRGWYSSRSRPYHVPATENHTSQHCQNQLMMMELEKELENARERPGENTERVQNTQQAWNVPARKSAQVDQQMQLMLLEQQNKHRLTQVRRNEAAYTPEEQRLAREQSTRELLAEQARYHPPPSGSPTVTFR